MVVSCLFEQCLEPVNTWLTEWSSNLEHFEKNDEHPSLIITEIIDSERVGCLNV